MKLSYTDRPRGRNMGSASDRGERELHKDLELPRYVLRDNVGKLEPL